MTVLDCSVRAARVRREGGISQATRSSEAPPGRHPAVPSSALSGRPPCLCWRLRTMALVPVGPGSARISLWSSRGSLALLALLWEPEGRGYGQGRIRPESLMPTFSSVRYPRVRPSTHPRVGFSVPPGATETKL